MKNEKVLFTKQEMQSLKRARMFSKLTLLGGITLLVIAMGYGVFAGIPTWKKYQSYKKNPKIAQKAGEDLLHKHIKNGEIISMINSYQASTEKAETTKIPEQYKQLLLKNLKNEKLLLDMVLFLIGWHIDLGQKVVTNILTVLTCLLLSIGLLIGYCTSRYYLGIIERQSKAIHVHS